MEIHPLIDLGVNDIDGTTMSKSCRKVNVFLFNYTMLHYDTLLWVIRQRSWSGSEHLIREAFPTLGIGFFGRLSPTLTFLGFWVQA